MRFLFIHQNFPGQFRHLVSTLADDEKHEVVGLGDATNVKPGSIHPRLRVLRYPRPAPGGRHTHHYLRDMEGHVRRGQQIVRAVARLQKENFIPDVVVAHSGWGEALFLREMFPSARHIQYCEYFYHAEGADLGFDDEFPVSHDDKFKVAVRNGTQLLSLPRCDAAVAPTRWQRSLYPAEFQPRITPLHEGIDTDLLKPDTGAVLQVGERLFRQGDEIVTYAARNLEPYRGFHVFMRTLPLLQAKRPDAQILIAGGDGVSYGRNLPNGETYRQKYQAELGEQVDWSRVHFLGKLDEEKYRKLLQVSAAHVYLTYPFVLSWSMLEAMSSGCLVIGSATPPVEEVITDGVNGLLVDFFDRQALAQHISDALENPAHYRAIRSRAREHVKRHYDLHGVCLPAWLDFLHASTPQTQSRIS